MGLFHQIGFKSHAVFYDSLRGNLNLKILIAGYFSAFWHEEAWCRSLIELGHEVIEFRIAPYFSSNILNKIQNRFLIGPIINRINSEFLSSIELNAPDIVLCYRALPFKPETIQKIQDNHSLFTVSYNNDNIYGALKHKAYWRFFKKTIPLFDLNLVFRKDDINRYTRDNAKAVYHLYHHYLPWLHAGKEHVMSKLYKSDICFLGHCEPDRRLGEMDSLMKEIPCRYSIHGSLWKENSKGHAWSGMDTHELQGLDYVNCLVGSKIALAFYSTWNEDQYTTRSFEIPACGVFMLSQRTDEMMRLYEEDKEAVYFNDIDELIDKAKFYLLNDHIREKIAIAGKNRCLNSGYDIYSRMREWISAAENIHGKFT